MCDPLAGNMLKIDIRRNRILDRLKRDGTVSVTALAAELGTTPVTIRSDLDALEAEGYLVRVQGGAVHNLRMPGIQSISSRESVNSGEKRVIARMIAQQVRDGDTLFLNSGTTMQAVAAALCCCKSLNVVTNSLAVAQELGSVPGFRVILLGGEINAQYNFIYGSDAQEQLSHYRADWAIMSLDGIDASTGLTTYHAEEATINRMMIERSKQLLIAADHTKVGRTGFFRFQDAGDHICLVTDAKADPDALSRLTALGVTVMTAAD